MDHEEEFLNTFFAQVAQLCTDKAKELVEKERGSCRQTQMGPWGMLLMHLPQIAVAEHSYADLGFLHTKNKGFLRKDNSLRTVYESLKSDLKRVEEMTRGTNSIGATVAEVSNQLCQYITAKIQLIDFYEKMYNMSINSKTMKYQELLQCIEGIVEIHSLSCSHLALTAIKASLTLECEILVQLTKAQVELQHWRFLSTLMALYGAQTRMSAWERTLQSKECLIFKSKSTTSIVSMQASPGEMRSIMSKQNVDYYHKIQSFQRKHDVLAVLIIFDSRGVEDAGLGYRHPRREPNTSEQFPVVLSCPSVFVQKPSIHLDNIQKRIKERHTELLAMDKIIYYKNVKDICTYAMYNTDPRMTLVTVSENGKQKDKEAHIASFMTDLCVQIRCNKIYESLKLSK
ncbi:KICSTOR complex protein C12orf66 homolog isoform X4 [Bombus bifarius]|uniref:KICSTOR complex protein C12orf66 homolog isoform X4 n=1 Tax=Bombus bifarius TaxID=103933 RepID=A0A6P8M458_9HYME|nr:KICSTOR complex protein C12orf66 homolog isoform X4 [Bombus vancouverensis nearcticus]XP_033302628.1 KICSTOR complex protein C12orf66 homolog isoform X4 [Bombus bifarius]